MIQLYCLIGNKGNTQWFSAQSSAATNRMKGICTVRKTIIIEAIVGIVSFLCAASCFADIKDGVAVTALPAPDGDGAYVFGNASYVSPDFWDNNLAAGLAYPVWGKVNVPSGSTVKFVGGVALSSLPEGCTFDFSGCTHLFATDASVFGSGFTIHEAMTCLFVPCSVTVSGATASFSVSSNTGTINATIELNGTNTIGASTGDIVFTAALTGSDAGYVWPNGFSRRVTFNGALAYGGTIRLRNSQRNQRVFVNSPDVEPRIGTLEGNDWGNNQLNQPHGAPQQLIYTPASSAPSTLVIGNLNQNEYGGLLEPDAGGHFRYRRWGLLLSTCSNNTIRVENITSKGAIHLLACSKEAYTFGNEPSFDEGFGNFEIVHLGKNELGHANRASVFYPSPNANLKFTGRFTGNYEGTAPSFFYTAESNVVNRASLDTTEATVYAWAHQTIHVTGFSPWNLPRTITSHERLKGNRMFITVTDTRWLMPLDFGAETNEIDVARCETDAVLSVPASGTVVVSNATTTAGVRPIAGRYPVITGNSVVNLDGVTGAEAFANWTVEPVGRWGGCLVLLDKTDTGLWMVVKQSGMAIRLR